MNQLFKIKDTFFSFLSPNRSAAPAGPPSKRRRTLGAGTPSKAAEHAYQPTSEPRGERAQAALHRRIVARDLASSDVNPRKRRRVEEEEELDEDTHLVKNVEMYDGGIGAEDERTEVEDHDSLSPDNSASQITPNESEGEGSGPDEDNHEGANGVGTYGDDEDLEPPDDPEATAREKVEEYLARQAELALKKEAIHEVKTQGGWHLDEIFLFERLSLRSYEELIPKEWQIDFRTLPEDIFYPHKDKVLINYNCLPSYHGVKALQPLLNLGLRVKGQPAYGTKYITRDVEQYIRWTERDGGYFKKRFIPVLTVVTATPNQQSSQITKTITAQMQFLAQKHRTFLALPEPRINEVGEVELYKRQPPLLYGIIVAQTMAIFVTLDSASTDAKLRHITHFDFKEPKVHVWNGFALAIICCIARNAVMATRDEYDEEDEPETDPDL